MLVSEQSGKNPQEKKNLNLFAGYAERDGGPLCYPLKLTICSCGSSKPAAAARAYSHQHTPAEI